LDRCLKCGGGDFSSNKWGRNGRVKPSVNDKQVFLNRKSGPERGGEKDDAIRKGKLGSDITKEGGGKFGRAGNATAKMEWVRGKVGGK